MLERGVFMLKVLRKMSLRLGIILSLLILQIAAFIGLAVFIIIRFPFVSYIGFFISFLVFLFILKKDEASAYKLTWIIIVLLLPAVGGMMYLLYGKEHRARRRIVDHVNEHALIAKLLDCDENLPDAKQVGCDRMYSLMQYVRRSSSYHAYMDTATKYYPMGDLMFDDMLGALERAKRFIFLEFFIIHRSEMWNKLLEVLIRKAAEGVEVRVIIDDFGSQRLFTNAYIAELRGMGIAVLRFNPLIPFMFVFMNNRDHRKILVVDGEVAFVGGINIGDEYIGKNDRLGVWKDSGLRLKGEGVWSFSLMFIEMWDTFCKAEERIHDHTLYRGGAGEDASSVAVGVECEGATSVDVGTECEGASCVDVGTECEGASSVDVGNECEGATSVDAGTEENDALCVDEGTEGFVLPYGDSPLEHDRVGENIYVDILDQAVNYVYIFTPYLIISEKMIHALQMAAKRGVDVRIVMPGIPDKKIVFRLSRSYYNSLLEAGVRIYEFTPGFLHAKSFVCDDKVAVVGTINLDYRSLYLHFECAALLYKTPSVLEMRDDAIETLNQSREVLLGERRAQALMQLFDAFLHLFAPLM